MECIADCSSLVSSEAEREKRRAESVGGRCSFESDFFLRTRDFLPVDCNPPLRHFPSFTVTYTRHGHAIL